MKIAIYSARPDEVEFFHQAESQLGVELKLISVDPTIDTVDTAAGCDAVSVVTKTFITAELLDAYQAMGIRFISTRTMGFEHIDMDYAKKIGMGVGNVTYTPYSVAEYAVMMMMMAMRHVKTMSLRAMGQDYALTGIRGRLLNTSTVGIIGTGKIGATVAKILTGFGCEILAYDVWQNPDLADIVRYVTLDELLSQSDVVTLHTPSTPESYHLMNSDTIGKMKQGAVLVNTARGELVDSMALVEAIENEHLGGAALDLIEGDRLIYYRDKKCEQLKNRNISLLNGLPNVITTPHMAFFTDASVRDMVMNSIQSCIDNVEG